MPINYCITQFSSKKLLQAVDDNEHKDSQLNSGKKRVTDFGVLSHQ